MVKAVFIDYMGTTVDEHSPVMTEIVRRICKSSSLHDPGQVQRFILDTRRRYEADSYLDTYLTEDEIVTRLILDMEAQIELRDDPAALRDLIHSHWVNASVFPDAYTFFDRCPVPIYIITNNGLPYMEQALRHNGLKAAGVVSADTARATSHTGKYLMRPCASADIRRTRLSTSVTPMTPTWWERGLLGLGRCCFCGDARGGMTTWMPQTVWDSCWN